MSDDATPETVRQAYAAGFEAGRIADLGWPSPPRPRDPRFVRLDEAQARGPEAYNEERRRQGLIEYDLRGTEASWDAFVEEANRGRV